MLKPSSPIRRTLVVPGIIIVLALAGVGVAGQAPDSLPGLVAQVLTAIGVLQTNVDDLETTLGEVQDAVAGLAPTESNVRVTPAAFFRAGVMDCIATNVTDADRHVRIEMINTTTGAEITSDSGSIAIVAGRARSVGLISTAFTGRAYCRFTVLDDGARDRTSGATW